MNRMIRGLSEVRHLASCYRGTSLRTRLHVYGRWFLCPFNRILEHLPDDTCHLDVGCGHGILLTLMRRAHPQQVLRGIDPSHQKIEQARDVTSPNLSFEVSAIEDVERASCDSLSVVDVLYLLSPSQLSDFLRACHVALRPNGVLVVKETSRTPYWKFFLTLVQELFAVKIFGITKGRHVVIRPAEAIAAALVEAGFTPPTVQRIDRGYSHPHTLFVSRTGADSKDRRLPCVSR